MFAAQNGMLWLISKIEGKSYLIMTSTLKTDVHLKYAQTVTLSLRHQMPCPLKKPVV